MKLTYLSCLLLLILAFSSCDGNDTLTAFELNSQADGGEMEIACADGAAGDYSCSNIDLLARVSPSDMNGERLNDIWGWTDPQGGSEYALVGLTDGIAFVDVTVPTAPVVVGKLEESAQAGNTKRRTPGMPDEKSSWRDFKVYENHLFVVSDGQVHGMQIFDLARLREVTDPPASFSADRLYTQFEHAHNIAVNEETGFAYVVGSELDGGGLHIIDISDPRQPVFTASYSDSLVGRGSDGYVHDTQCATYRGPDRDYAGRELCFNSSESHMAIVDVTDKEEIFTISRSKYEGVQYVHQGWLTADHRYFIQGDEFDERMNDHNTRTYIWDLEELDAPVLAGYHQAETASIDHNLYIKGEHVYQSNYTSGLRIFELAGPESAGLQEVGYFDTYPGSDSPIFDGAWSNYPYFDSGIVIVSDMSRGLFVLEPNL